MSGTGEPHGEERERPGPCLGRMHEEEEEGECKNKEAAETEEEEEEEGKKRALKQTCPGDEERGGTCVAMETASSGNGWFATRQKQLCGKSRSRSRTELSLSLSVH
ncbi:reticulon-1a isoform X1 [Tachysurus ichikawai]